MPIHLVWADFACYSSAGETGFTAHLEFVGGAPPYTVRYRSYRRGDTPKDHIKTHIYQARDDIVIRPERPGKYVFVGTFPPGCLGIAHSE